MRRDAWLMLLLGFALIGTVSAGTIEDARQRGSLVVGVKDSLPPFGFVEPASRQIVGYDVDFASAIARRLGVRLVLKPVTSANRMPQLAEGNIDMIVATMTKTAERAKQIGFSHTYFHTGQKFLARKGTVNSLKDLDGQKIGTAKGSTSEQNARKAVPSATVLSFDDYPQAFLALQQRKVAAVTTDEAILAGILAKAPNRDAFEIPALQISDEPYGIGVRRGDQAFLDFVNATLLEMEASGEAKAIFERWFGPGTDTPLARGFVIKAD